MRKICLVLWITMSPGVRADVAGSTPSAARVPDLAAVTARRDAQLRAAPRRVRWLAARPIGSYLPIATLVDPAARARGQERLLADLREVLGYFEAHAPSEVRDRVEPRLARFAARVSYRRLARTTLTATGARTPVASLTLEQFIAREEFAVLKRETNPFARAWALLAGPHLRGASPGVISALNARVGQWLGRVAVHPRVDGLRKFAPVLAVVGTSALTLWAVEHFGHTHFLTGFFLGAVQVGVLGPLVSAATGWLVTPTTEYLKVWNSRFTGEAEQSINHFFDRFKPKLAADSYDEVRVARVGPDGGDVAGMTPRQQLSGWQKVLRMCNGVPMTYNRLLRHSQHHGRALITALWSDEVQTATMAQQLEQNLIDLRTNDETMLGPHRTALLVNGNAARNDQLTEAYLNLTETLTRQPWAELRGAKAERVHARAKAAIARLRLEFGIPAYVVDRLVENQRRAAESTAVLVGTLAVNELRYLFYAEANRNMEDETREVQRQIRRGLLIQTLVERYQPEIQAIHRKMGFENGTCETKLAA